MRISKRSIIYSFIFIVAFFFVITFELPYYIYKPGHVDRLDEMIEIENGHEATGDMHLVTISGAQATPIQYLFAKFYTFNEIIPIEDARPEGISDEEYMQYQLQLMENSHQASIAVAYRAANKEVMIEHDGVLVIDVIKNMPADGILEIGDQIIQVDERNIQKAEELVDYVETKQAGETITLVIDRDGERMNKSLTVMSFPESDEKVGIGIRLVTNQRVTVDPPAQIKSGSIGGPSAGLMFALEIYNQLTEMDISKGYHIAGTGEIDFDGNVHRIGGIDKKVVAAHRQGMEIFFAPNEEGNPDSNYHVAKETVEQINSTMKVVPVDTFQDALSYLEQLEPK